jgi:YhgE/Pip-like protein
MSDDSSATARRRAADPRLPVRASHLLRVPTLWILPLLLGSVVVAIMSWLYISAAVNPVAHLRGLPVAIVNEDRGATVGARHLDLGQQVQAGLLGSPAVSGRLGLVVSSLPAAEQSMDSDDLYAMVVIPPDFTASLVTASGLSGAGATGAGATGAAPAVPRTQILTSQRAGTTGVSLATGILQPALAAASRQIGQHLAASVPASAQTPATKVFLANPVTVTTAQYRPLPANAALGLSAFYIALLTMMCGFLGAIIVNNAVDSALGYSTNEIGPRFRQRQPVPISRWQTLLIKWAIAAPLTGVLTAVMLAIAAGALGMDAPHLPLLWLFTWLCAASVGIGTIVLFAVAGTFGQLIAILLFVYAGLASAGGTVPIQALPGFLRWLANVEPLRQILSGTRSIMYFDAQADAGLTRGVAFAAIGLLCWLVLGTAVVRWYDRKRLYRIHPDTLAHVSDAVQDIKRRQAAPAAARTDPSQPPPADPSQPPR